MKNMTQQMVTIGLLALLVLAGCGAKTETATPISEKSADKAPIKIGWIGPLTGSGSAYGLMELNAAKIAVNDINDAGGIDGRQIELSVEDGKCDGPTTVTATNKLTEVDNVKYIAGGHCSTETFAMIPITESKKVMIVALTSSDKFTGSGNYSFRTTPSQSVYIANLGDFAYKAGSRKIATLSEQKDFSDSVIRVFTKSFEENGGKIVTKETFAPGTVDFKTQLMKIKEQNPDALMLSAQGPDSAAAMITQIEDLDLPRQIYGDIIVVSPATYNKTGGKLPPTAYGGTVHSDLDRNPKTRDFLAKYTSSNPGQMPLDPFFAAEGYDQITVLSDMIKSCGDDTDCARSTITTKEWDGMMGKFRFDSNGDATPMAAIVRIVDGKQVFEGGTQ